MGDIIVSINGSRVLESSHGDVVRIAHAASDELQLEVRHVQDQSRCSSAEVVQDSPGNHQAGGLQGSGLRYEETAMSRW